jgi:phage baseplate assembly protein W
MSLKRVLTFKINNVMATFKGFSTIDRVRSPYTLVDRDLIKQDLLNTFYTRKGERVMRPNYGSDIWDLLMNPDDDLTKSEIENDVRRIIDAEPRVNHVETVMFFLDQTIRIEVTLQYVATGDQDYLYLEYVRQSTAAADNIG